MLFQVSHLILGATSLLVTYTNVTTGSCLQPEKLNGGYWTCYNNKMCVLHENEGMKCKGRIKCVDNQWKSKPGRPEPFCITKRESNVTIPVKQVEKYHKIIQILTTTSNGITFVTIILLSLILRKIKYYLTASTVEGTSIANNIINDVSNPRISKSTYV